MLNKGCPVGGWLSGEDEAGRDPREGESTWGRLGREKRQAGVACCSRGAILSRKLWSAFAPGAAPGLQLSWAPSSRHRHGEGS